MGLVLLPTRASGRRIFVCSASFLFLAALLFYVVREQNVRERPPRAELHSPPVALTNRPQTQETVPTPPSQHDEAAKPEAGLGILAAAPERFSGPLTICGVVLDHARRQVSGATVVFRPGVGACPMWREEYVRLTSTSDDRGEFRHDALPDTSEYEVFAFKGGSAGRTYISGAQGRVGQVVVEVAPLAYDCYSFVDDATDAPIDMSRLHSRIGWGDVLLTTDEIIDGLPGDLDRLAILYGLGLDLGALDSTRIAVVYRGRGGVRLKGDSPQRRRAMRMELDSDRESMYLPSYGRVRLRREYRDMSEWCSYTEIRVHRALHPDPWLCHEVVFPQMPWLSQLPRELRAVLDLRLTVTTREPGAVTQLTRRKSTFLSAREAFVLYQTGWAEMPLAVTASHGTEGTVRVALEQRPYGYLEMRFGSTGHARVEEVQVRPLLGERVGPPLWATIRWGGAAFAGTVPAGRYVVMIGGTGHDGTSVLRTIERPIDVVEGRNVIELD